LDISVREAREINALIIDVNFIPNAGGDALRTCINTVAYMIQLIRAVCISIKLCNHFF